MEKVGAIFIQEHDLSKNKLHKRCIEIERCAETVEKHLISIFGKNLILVLSAERLQCAITSYFYDVLRYKQFHGMLDKDKVSLVNFPKVYSYLSKWIIKEKPFYLDTSGFDFKSNELTDSEKKRLNRMSNYINELILVSWYQESYEAHFKEPLIISSEEGKSFLYNFKYRPFSENILEMFFKQKIDNKDIAEL